MWKLLKTLRDCRAEPASLCARVDGLERRRRRRRRWRRSRSRSRLWGWFRRCDAVNGGFSSMCCDHVLASLLAVSLCSLLSHGWQAFSNIFLPMSRGEEGFGKLSKIITTTGGHNCKSGSSNNFATHKKGNLNLA